MSLPKSEHPLFDIEIPSLKTKVKFRPSLYKEEKILLMAKETKEPSEILKAIRAVVNNCVVTPKFNIDTMDITDLEWVFLRIRMNSISNVSTIRFLDKTDNKEYDFRINLDDVTIQYPDPRPSDKIEHGDITIQLRYPSSALYEDGSIMMDTSGLNEKLKRACIAKVWKKDEVFSLSDVTDGEFHDWLDELPVPVVSKINDFINNPPTLFYEIKYKNSKGEDRSIKLTTLDDFFTLL